MQDKKYSVQICIHILCFKYVYFYDNLNLNYHYSVCMKSFLRDPLFYELYKYYVPLSHNKVELWEASLYGHCNQHDWYFIVNLEVKPIIFK